MSDKHKSDIKAPAFSALALAFASLGDAFIYPFLPLNSYAMEIPGLWVGVILSVNRFIRVFSNTLMVRLFSKYELRSVIVIAGVLGIISTFCYAIATGVVALMLLRIIWGIAFSALRMGAFGYALQHEKRGLVFGLSKGIQEAGPTFALFLSPVLLGHMKPNEVFYVLSLLSLPAVFFAWKLPINSDKVQVPKTTAFLNWPSHFNSITLVSAIVIDGLIVVVLGFLFLESGKTNLVAAAALAAFYLGYRRVCLVALSWAGGWISVRLGMDRIYNVSLVFVILGLVFIICGWISTGALIVFTFYSINSAITPALASQRSHSLVAIAENATWRDIGAGIGTLIGGLLISSQYVVASLIIAVLIMVSLLTVHSRRTWSALKLSYLWK